MNILFLTENFPPETNAAASRVYERACYWVRWGHTVTVVTCAPNFPRGVLFDGYRNRWHQTEVMDGIRVVRVKTFIAANRGVVLRSLARISHQVTAADTNMTTFAALNAARVLDVLSSTPARPDSRSPCKCSHLRALARNLVRNAG